MREIKFRAWNKINRRMITDFDNWVDFAGNYWTVPDRTYDTPNQEIIKIDDIILMQYTGLKDKNGKEIYGGDIFGEIGGDKERPNEYEVFGEVYFDLDFAGFCVKYPNGGWSTLGEHLLNFNNHREVIGNTMENPDLIK